MPSFAHLPFNRIHGQYAVNNRRIYNTDSLRIYVGSVRTIHAAGLNGSRLDTDKLQIVTYQPTTT